MSLIDLFNKLRYQPKISKAERLSEQGHHSDAVAVLDELRHKYTPAFAALVNLHLSHGKDSEQSDGCESLFAVLELCRQIPEELTSFGPEWEQSALEQIHDAALRKYRKGNKQEAKSLAARISQYGDKFMALSCEFILADAEVAGANEKLDIFARGTENLRTEFSDIHTVDLPPYTQIYQEWKQALFSFIQSQPYENGLRMLSGFKAVLRSGLAKSQAAPIFDEINAKIAEIRFLMAQEAEKAGKLTDAILLYEQVGDTDAQLADKCELRTLICELRRSTPVSKLDKRIEKLINSAEDTTAKKDLIYRYIVALIQSEKTDAAIPLINKYFKQDKELAAFAQATIRRDLFKKLDEINRIVSELKSADMTLAQVRDLQKLIDASYDDFLQYLPDTKDGLVRLRQTIAANLVTLAFRAKDYYTAFRSLMSGTEPQKLFSGNNLRNVAIAALGSLEMDSNDYKEEELRLMIAVWLTAVYNTDVFVLSLDRTTWDDPYTFTIRDVLSRETRHWLEDEDCPFNVNDDQPQEKVNISIRETQDALLLMLDKIVSEHYPQLGTYVHSQRKVMDELAALAKVQNVIAPYLYSVDSSKSYPVLRTYTRELSKVLAYILGCDGKSASSENALRIASHYGLTSYTRMASYRKCEDLFSEALQAIKDKKKRLAATYAETIQAQKPAAKFPALWAEFIGKVSSSLGKSIQASMNFGDCMDIYYPFFRLSNNHTKILRFVRYIADNVRAAYNNNKIEAVPALRIVLQLFEIAPTNHSLRQDVEALINIVLDEMPKGADDVLQQASTVAGGAFSKYIQETKDIAELQQLIDNYNSKKIDLADALERIYDLYKRHPHDARICKNLVILVDNAVFLIINEDYRASRVQSVINSLLSNSSNEFKAAGCDKFRKSFFTLWEKFDSFNQDLLKIKSYTIQQFLNPHISDYRLVGYIRLGNKVDLSSLGNSAPGLSPSGIALKNGLEYFIKLAEL